MDKNMEDKNKINFNPIEEEDLNGSIFIPIIGVAFLAIGLFCYGHPVKGFNLMVTNIFSIAFLFLAFSMFILFISDLWFVGKKFDQMYRDKVLSVYKKDEERTKHPVSFFMAGLRPYRTLMYTRAIMMPRFSKKRSIFKESLKE